MAVRKNGREIRGNFHGLAVSSACRLARFHACFISRVNPDYSPIKRLAHTENFKPISTQHLRRSYAIRDSESIQRASAWHEPDNRSTAAIDTATRADHWPFID